MVAKGDVLELEIESAAFEGLSVAHVGDFVVFVRGAVPGDRVLARISKKKRRHAEAGLVEVLRSSAARIQAPCRYFGICGGCSWQNVDYPVQLQFKRQHVEDLFRRIGGLSEVEVLPVLGARATYHYRNKMEFTFSPGRWLTRQEMESGQPIDKAVALGLHVPERFDKVLDLEICHLQEPPSAEIVNQVRRLARDGNWSAYDTRQNTGYLRNLIIRNSRATGEVMVALVTNGSAPDRMMEVKDLLVACFPTVSTFVNIVNTTRSPSPVGDQVVYHGSGVISDQIGNISFTIGPTTFFQPNTEQAARLYEAVAEFSSLDGSQSVLDLYCGTGGISLSIAAWARSVFGIENHAPSVELARDNARRNDIVNCDFVVADATATLEILGQRGTLPDLVVLDPPRSGIHPGLYRTLEELKVRRVVYVSCNPATQARDLNALGAFYRVARVQPVDMFPQTYHIETVALLEKTG